MYCCLYCHLYLLPPVPPHVLLPVPQVSNNEVTRVVATLASLMFQSCVSPQLAVRVINAVVSGLLQRWYAHDSYQVRPVLCETA